jgi:hypothetical protein
MLQPKAGLLSHTWLRASTGCCAQCVGGSQQRLHICSSWDDQDTNLECPASVWHIYSTLIRNNAVPLHPADEGEDEMPDGLDVAALPHDSPFRRFLAVPDDGSPSEQLGEQPGQQ